MPKVFDALSFLHQEFGTADRVLHFLDSYGAPRPEKDAVHKWFQRGTMPSRWLSTLLIYMEIERGAPISMILYVKSGS